MEIVIGKRVGVSNVAKEEEARKIASKCELMIVVGRKNSNSTVKLYDISICGCNNAMIVETKEDLYMNYVRRFEKVGVVVEDSTSKERLKELLDILRKG